MTFTKGEVAQGLPMQTASLHQLYVGIAVLRVELSTASEKLPTIEVLTHNSLWGGERNMCVQTLENPRSTTERTSNSCSEQLGTEYVITIKLLKKLQKRKLEGNPIKNFCCDII